MSKTQALTNRRGSSLSDIAAIKAVVEEIAPQYDIERVYLFGSFARGEANASSDIDLCLETGPDFSLFNAGGIGYLVEKTLGRRADIVSEEVLFPHVRETMLRDRILIYERK